MAQNTLSNISLVANSSIMVSSTAVRTLPPDCSTVIPKGGMVIAEYFLTKYEYAYRRVAMFKASNFEHANIMHTNCQPVDVDGEFYFVAISPIIYDEARAYQLMDRLELKAKKEGLKFGLLRIVRNQE